MNYRFIQFTIKPKFFNNLLAFQLFVLCMISQTILAQSFKILDVLQEEDSVKIEYNLLGGRDKDKFLVELEVSKNGGKTFTISPKAVMGEVGYGITRGFGKVIWWSPLKENLELEGDEFVFKLSGTLLGTELEIETISITGGEFEMGDIFNEGEIDELPVHKVKLDDFELGKFEVTNNQFANFLNKYGSDKVLSGPFKGESIVFQTRGGLKKVSEKWIPEEGYEYHPVVGVTWYGANEFCQFHGYRLPTEAEWEYAARSGGKSSKYSQQSTVFDGNLFNFNKYIDFDSLNVNNGIDILHSENVGAYPPNELSIFQMSGNVWEYCIDWYKWNN